MNELWLVKGTEYRESQAHAPPQIVAGHHEFLKAK